jgi:hypothetical protein
VNADDWAPVWAAIATWDLEEAGRLILRTDLLPGLEHQFQAKFPRIPSSYIEDALAEAVSETLVRLQLGAEIENFGASTFQRASALDRVSRRADTY